MSEEQLKLLTFALQVFLSFIQTHTLTVAEVESDPVQKEELKAFYVRPHNFKSILEHFDLCIKGWYDKN